MPHIHENIDFTDACREGIIAGLTIITKGSDGNAIVQETPEPRQGTPFGA